MRRLIILRPEPGAIASLERAKALGLDAISIPLFEVCPLAWTPPDPDEFDAVLATSANAMRHAGAALKPFRHLPLHAVGEVSLLLVVAQIVEREHDERGSGVAGNSIARGRRASRYLPLLPNHARREKRSNHGGSGRYAP